MARNWHGMNWINKTKRLGIYLRDGLSCGYCGRGIEEGIKMTLDHIVPDVDGGTNHESNLITCCKNCNSQKNGDSLVVYLSRFDAERRRDILDHVYNRTSDPLRPYWNEAKEIIKIRPSWTAVLEDIRDSI